MTSPTTPAEIHGLDGEIWSLTNADDELYLQYTPDGDLTAPLVTIPVDEHVLAALWRASRPAAVVVGDVVVFPRRCA